MLSRIISIFFTMGLAIAGYSQTANIQNDTIRWNATGFTDLLANVVADSPCQFITYGDRQVDWVQANGGFVTSFTAISVLGSWQDLNINGSITIGLTADMLTGQIVFTRSDQGLKAEITVTGGSADIKNSYTISSFEKL